MADHFFYISGIFRLMKNPGYLVKTPDGRIGRTKNRDGLVNGKVPVYIATEMVKVEAEGERPAFEFPKSFAETGTLFNLSDLTSVGMID
jgi:hypothetical protein